jgi:hypothetical protein
MEDALEEDEGLPESRAGPVSLQPAPSLPEIVGWPTVERGGHQLDHVTVRIFEVEIPVTIFLMSQRALENLHAFGLKIVSRPVYLLGRAEP